MSERDDIDGVPEDDLLAAELALGALEFDLRARLQARAAWDPAFAAKVAEWEALLSPMAAAIPEVAPPAAARARLVRELFGTAAAIPSAGPAAAPEAPPPAHARIRRELAGWRALALAGAAALALLVAQPQLLRFGAPELQVMAVIASEEGELAFVAMLDEASGRLLARRAGGDGAGTANVHQLWMATDGDPVSLGIVEDGPLRGRIPPEMYEDGALPPSTHFAVSLEPPGGSPTGLPTGPVVARGGRPEGL